MKLLVIYGGNSFEHNISLISASNVIENLKNLEFDFDEIFISKDNKWYFIKENNKVELFNIIEFLKKYDLVLPIMHGAYGEDGKLQAFFELFNIKYIGSNSVSSMICMDKYLTKLLIEKHNIKQVPYQILTKNDKINIDLNFPVIVKPVNGGSSIGINVAKNKQELKKFVKNAFKYDTKVIVEKFIKNREFECAIIENNNLVVSNVGEIKYSHEFYDYTAKYDDDSEIIIPASISKELEKAIQNEALNIFKILDLKGFARIDFLYDENENILYFNEVNTIPGFTKNSMFPLLFKNKKLDFKKILGIIIKKN